MSEAVENVNDAPSGEVLLEGLAQEDETLTVDASEIGDADGLGPFTYKWQRDGVDISGATGTAYTLGQSDVGTFINPVVSYTDGFGTEESLFGPSGLIANVNDLPTGEVTISGDAIEDAVLTAETATIADEDGLGTFSYRWMRDGVEVSGATAATYTLSQADVGAAISVEVRYTDAYGTEESLTSAATDPVVNVNDAPTGSVEIDGSEAEDQTLTANVSSIADEDGLGAFSFRWLRDGAEISGATAATLSLTQADVGSAIVSEVFYTDAFGAEETLASTATGPIQNVNDAPTGALAVTGDARENETLTADASAIVDEDGLGTFSFRWMRDGVEISGENAATYILTSEDVGTAITAEVFYTDAQGTDESVVSAASAIVQAAGLDLVGTPDADTLSGAEFDDTLTGLDGADRLIGNSGNDSILGGLGADTLNGGDGDDIIIGGPDSGDLRDVVYAGAGSDNVSGGAGNDLLIGMAGDDTLAGGFGADELQGQDGNDVITGSAFSDLVFGGNGDDFVNGGFGFDRINGGSGADKFFHQGVEGHGSDWVQDYLAAEGDVLLFGNAAATADDFQVNFTHTTSPSGERSGDDTIEEAFVIYKPTGQIMWALVDGGGQDEINLKIGADVFDLLA